MLTYVDLQYAASISKEISHPTHLNSWLLGLSPATTLSKTTALSRQRGLYSVIQNLIWTPAEKAYAASSTVENIPLIKKMVWIRWR